MSKRCMGCMELFEDQYEICPHCGYVVGTSPEEPIHLLPGSILQDRYIVGKVLGYGGFGATYLAWDGKLEQKVAIREYLPAEFSTRMPGQSEVTVFSGAKNEQFHAGLKKFVEEAKRVGKFQNEPGIVKIFDTFEENSTAYIVMEYLEGETLSAYLKREGTISEDKAVEMLMPVMQSLIRVHEEGLLHRDIAPDNIFLAKTGEAKLIDFGASRYATTSHSRSLTVIVKPGYSPEEQYRSRSDQGPHTDVYSLSATLYKMVTGKTPPDAMERRAKYENKNKDILVEPHKLNKSISRGREVAILNAMNVRIEDRTPDIASFISELNADPPAKRRYGKIKKIDVYAWPLWLKVALPTLLAVIVVFGVLLLTGVINFSRYTKKVVIPSNIVRAPFVEGTSYEEALEKIEGKGELHIKISGNVESDYIAPGMVMFQTPVAGAFLEKNSDVLLLISAGNGVVEPRDGNATIPFFTGDTRETAIDKCKIAGLGEPQFEEVYDETMAEGLVVSASKQTGEIVPVGTVITIQISKGPAPFVIENVVGMEESAAKSVLEKQGLIVDVSYNYDATVPEGCVISQSAAAGEYVKRGERATIVVSTGEKLTEVPNVVGQTKEDAQKMLEDSGFEANVLENNDDTVPAGIVISQTPGAGTAQKEKTQVTIIVSLGASQNATPTPQATSKPTPTQAPKGTATPAPTSAPTSTPVPGKTPTPSPVPTKAPVVKKTVNVSFDSNGAGTSYDAKKVTCQEPYGDLPSPSRTGYGFDGWYTSKDGGSKVSADSIVSIETDHCLYAHWTAGKYTLTFNANGGSTSEKERQVNFGSAYGKLPSASQDYNDFLGWYTAQNGGQKVSETTIVSGSTTLYAHWQLHPESDWVPADSVPAGAQITNTKWRYTKTTTKTSPNASESGWTRDDSKTTWVWSAWTETGWTRTPQTVRISEPDSDWDEYVETKTVTDRAGYYLYTYSTYRSSDHKLFGTKNYQYGGRTANVYDEITIDHQLSLVTTGNGSKVYGEAHSNNCSHTYTNCGRWVYYNGSTWVPPQTHTEYNKHTKTKIYTYYYYKTETKEEVRPDAPSGTGISNVQKYVKYRAK